MCVAELVADPGTLATLASALSGIFLLWVQASALRAILVIFVTTAVATVPIANLEVVQVIAIAVTFKLLDPATFWLSLFFLLAFELRVETGAESAVLLSFGFIGLDVATVATIPTARAVVIGIVTEAVAFENEVSATTALTFDVLIETGALLAVTELHFAVGSATITSIPVTTAIVVIVITLAVTLPRVYLAGSRATFILGFVVRIQAVAIDTMGVFVFLSATVTAVPTASTVVVIIVTGLITLPCGNFATTIACLIGCRVQTVAFGAVAVLGRRVFVVSAAVTAVPTAAAYVVNVVAIAIAFPNMYPTLSVAFHPFAVDEKALVIRVLTQAVFTVCFEVHIVRPAAIATVPVASTIIVCFVTNSIALPTKHVAS